MKNSKESKEIVVKRLISGNRVSFVLRAELQNYLHESFDGSFGKMRKVELEETFNKHLTTGNINKCYSLPRFGLIAKDVEAVLNISPAKRRRLTKEGAIKEKDTIKLPASGYHVIIYDLESIVNYLAMNPAKKCRNEDYLPELSDRNIAEALYIINKSAKVSRDTKADAYNKRNHTQVQASKTRERNLYQLKDAAIDKLIQEGRIKLTGYHSKDGRILKYYSIEGFTFHRPYKGALEVTAEKIIHEDITAERTRQDVNITFNLAVRILKAYVGITGREVS